ncbi:MAG: HAMP domain-containing histidine kinase [Verrucomicrobia bacterium]|nr:HAMP domain-containing histidine kinase [Verrucomicrobiota bacterium]
MSPASRRILVYWLLLLLPTLAVGTAAILLLRREQARLEEGSAAATAARRATLADRARLTVETIELLVGEVQTGLLDTLAAEPAEGVDRFLDRWERENPLVQTAFRAMPDGRIVRPDARSAHEEARGFLRRFPRHFGTVPPWSVAAVPANSIDEPMLKGRAAAESALRKEVSQNVSQAQSARRDVQELLRAPPYSNAANFQSAGASPPATAAPAGRAVGSPLAATESAAERQTEADQRMKQEDGAVRGRLAAAAPLASVAKADQNAKLSDAAATLAAKDLSAGRRGWLPAMVDGRLHLAGWVQSAGGGEIRGVELNLAALTSRLGATLPLGLAAGEGYALRDEQGRILHQSGTWNRASEPAVRVPLSAAMLPGWELAGQLVARDGGGEAAPGFLWATTLLVVLLVLAIVAGGSLLWWQARRSEAEAAQKTSFVANVSHEFKTPLTTIRLYSELLEQGRVRDAAQGADYLRTIGRETQRLARLVNNALDFSRLEQGKKKFALEPLDLTAELARLLDTHAPRVAEAGLTLNRDLPASALNVTTDRDALGQIVLNLIDNACKYAAHSTGSGQAAGGVVLVALAPRTMGGAEVRVADRGPGVPVEHRERIFEKFHRVDEALTAEKSGAGLGLSIARQLARGLGGELRYASRKGGGAEFILELP